MRVRLPLARPGQAIGLLGGSFDPAHDGHVHITHEALKRFDLDAVWWLISPGNPLKPKGPAALEKRVTRAQALVRHPRVKVTDLEARLGTRYTADTLSKLMMQAPGTRFVWLMGADNLAEFHRWQNWQDIMQRVPIGVLARPGARISARLSPAARLFARHRVPSGMSHKICHARAPAWCFVNVPMVAQSSTAIRATGGWAA